MLNKWLTNEKIKKNLKPIALILMGIFIFCSWLIQNNDQKDKNPNPTGEWVGVDTYIPNGFVLVPIEIQNLASLDSLVGQYALVDLYAVGSPKPLAKGIKLIRSPKDPSQFAVLIKDEISQNIVRQSDKPFQVVLQNPTNPISQIKQINRSKINWED